MTAREVELSGGSPWGFRMHGGVDQNQPLRISRVNPGRKASLGGIREGDVISSINGRLTKGMSNAEAHAMLRSAGPTLRLGLNEDRDVSPRRRSIGKGSELKRPSHLLTEQQREIATPQAPVYATIRPPHSPQNKPNSPTKRSSISSLPSLTSTPLVKSISHDETPKYHPTNPFYTTLPSNYSSASKLSNGRTPMSSLDRKKTLDTYKNKADLKSPSNLRTNSGLSSLPYTHNNELHNGLSESYNEHNSQKLNGSNKETRNPFQTDPINDPFEKYLRRENGRDRKVESERTIPNSLSDSTFYSNEEVIERCTITEEKISEIEEIKTIKKVILNGNSGSVEQNGVAMKIGLPYRLQNEFKFQSQPSSSKEIFFKSSNYEAQRSETKPSNEQSYLYDSFDRNEITRNELCGDSRLEPCTEQKVLKDFPQKPPVETPNDAVTTKPPTPVTSQHCARAPTTAPSPSKRK